MKLSMIDRSWSGMLITFCGLDGCGKTTQISKLKEHFENLGITSVLTKQPTDSVRNSEIFRTFMDCENNEEYEYRALSLLAASDRVQHSNKVILPILKDGQVVISDRYFYSCLANLRARGYTNDQWIYEIAKSIPKPDIAFFLDVPVDVAINRVRLRPSEKDRYIDIELQYKLKQEYINIAKENGGILLSSDMNEEECFELIKQNISKVMQNV
ncbi:MAG: dTMP kinase [Bacillota bacterium]|nr:dTMP kinase [Bacillota bacterium]